MPILDQKNEEECERIREFFENSEYASFYQSFEWGKIKSDKWHNEFVYIEENGEIIAAMLVLVRKIGKIFTMMYAQRGPIMDIYDTELLQRLVAEADILAKKYNAFVLKMDPEIEYSRELEEVLRNSGFRVKNEFKNILEPMQTVRSMILDINNKTEENLLTEYTAKTRYNVRLAIKKGVTVRWSQTEDDLKIFYELMKVTAVRDRIAVRAYEYYKEILETYQEKARIYIAEFEGEPLSAALTINYGGRVTYFYGASANQKRNLMPTYLMQQTMIEWGLETNCRTYDFGGIFNTTLDNGLYRFKEGFCHKKGATKFIGEIDKVYNNFLYFIFSNILPKIKKIRLDINDRRNKSKKV